MSTDTEKRQGAVALRVGLKEKIEEHMEAANELREKQLLRPFNRSDIVALALKKITKDDYLSN